LIETSALAAARRRAQIAHAGGPLELPVSIGKVTSIIIRSAGRSPASRLNDDSRKADVREERHGQIADLRHAADDQQPQSRTRAKTDVAVSNR